MMTGFAIGVGAGVICMVYGLITMIGGRSFLFGGNNSIYTDQSVKLFARLSGFAEMIIGIAAIIYGVGTRTSLALVLGWFCGAVIWIAIASVIALYMSVLTKK